MSHGAACARLLLHIHESTLDRNQASNKGGRGEKGEEGTQPWSGRTKPGGGE